MPPCTWDCETFSVWSFNHHARDHHSHDQTYQFGNIDQDVQRVINDAGMSDGIVTLFVPYTTAAVTINENADPDVLRDMESGTFVK